MISALHIQDYQSHKDTVLKLSPGVNAIVGPSDSGKSAILRALRWVVENKPTGNDFIRHGSKSVSVEVVVDGQTVTRSKTPSTNTYTMGSQPFAALGVNVPQEVEKHLNLQPVNLQWQHDAPFLLSCSAGEVARTLNAAAGLDDIDKAFTSINKMVRENTTATSHNEGELTAVNVKLQGFEGLDDLVALADTLSQEEQKVRAREEKVSALARLVAGLEKADEKVQRMVVPKKVVDTLIRLEKGMSRMSVEEQRLRDIVALVKKANGLARIIEKGEPPEISRKLLSIAGGIEAQTAREKRLSGLVGGLLAAKKREESSRKSLAEYQREWEKDTPDVCPLCEQKWEHKHG